MIYTVGYENQYNKSKHMASFNCRDTSQLHFHYNTLLKTALTKKLIEEWVFISTICVILGGAHSDNVLLQELS